MLTSINLTKSIVASIPDLELKDIAVDNSNAEYEGATFSIGNRTYRSRLAKKTPKKKGYFVALWEKSPTGENQPYPYETSPDKVIISVIDNQKKGQFVFPKDVLLEKEALRNDKTKGKMAIRIYPPWEANLNKIACTTQKWQQPYFVEISTGQNIEKLRELYL